MKIRAISQSLDCAILAVFSTRRDLYSEGKLEMLREARRRGPLRGIMHSFTGSVATAAECIELGMHISFAGMVSYKKNDELRQVAAVVKADRILIETDSPYLSPQAVRGKRNEPAFVAHVLASLAELRGTTAADLARQTTQNFHELFKP